MTVDDLKKLGADTEEGIKRCAGNEAFYMKLVPMALDESKYSPESNRRYPVWF